MLLVFTLACMAGFKNISYNVILYLILSNITQVGKAATGDANIVFNR